ncbi:helix-turn-helix transcriptional regulator [Kocuria sp. TGY1127_2]|uniref:helix-turn-helix domain-containing protein n=1 Tax=Kocuria sp. TGY1127_2 TaxID=2711328 RepID=UPI0015BA59DF|nr:helix-turn-helix transcriptional regulator [Kocuria sp. TGY1127_2]
MNTSTPKQRAMDNMMEAWSRVIDRLITARERQDISLEHMAKLVKLNTDDLDAIECLDSSPRLEVLVRYADAVGMELKLDATDFEPLDGASPTHKITSESRPRGKWTTRFTRDKSRDYKVRSSK